MARAPFRITQPAPAVSTEREPIAPPSGQAVVRSQRTGDPLPLPTNESPGHSATIPWSTPVASPKPFKTK